MSIIIDTDIGSDIDDAIAIAYGIRAGCDIGLITTVHGDTTQRARICRRLTELLGTDIPIAAGAPRPIKQKMIFESGLEGTIDASDWIPPADGIERIAAYLDRHVSTDIIAIGPLTNIASVLQRYPGAEKHIGRLYLMGNAIITPGAFYLNYRAHNFKVDPEAVDVVFASNTPITIVTTDICKRSSFSTEDFDRLAASTPANKWIAAQAANWLKFIGYESAPLYDPLVLHHHIDDNITTKQVYENVRITTDVKSDFRRIVRDALVQECDKGIATQTYGGGER